MYHILFLLFSWICPRQHLHVCCQTTFALFPCSSWVCSWQDRRHFWTFGHLCICRWSEPSFGAETLVWFSCSCLITLSSINLSLNAYQENPAHLTSTKQAWFNLERKSCSSYIYQTSMIQFGKVDVQQTLFVDTFSYKSKSRSKSKSKSKSKFTIFLQSKSKSRLWVRFISHKFKYCFVSAKVSGKTKQKANNCHPSHQKASWSLDSKSVPSRVWFISLSQVHTMFSPKYLGGVEKIINQWPPWSPKSLLISRFFGLSGPRKCGHPFCRLVHTWRSKYIWLE